MFKRLTTSLTKPPLAVFFMKDSWGRVILYLIFVPLLLMIPAYLKSWVSPGMSVDRYELLTKSIQQNMILTDTFIQDGQFQSNQTASSEFEYFQINIGEYEPTQDKIHFVFLNTDLAIYVTGIEVTRSSYTSIGLENYDFSDGSSENIRILASGIKAMYEQTSLFQTAEIFVAYFTGLFDYVFYAFLMALLMMLFTKQIPIPFKMRLKLSIYLSTIYVFIALLAILFNEPLLGYVTIPILYIWHFWAYRSIKIVDRGLTV